MKIGIRRNNYFQADEWKDENPNKQNLAEPIPPKTTPTIELLTTYPPKYRINGQIVFIPKGMTPEEYYKCYMEENFYEKEKKPKISTFAEKSAGLHPLRKQYLKNRLQELDYLERQQSHQDDFTTRLYGKKDLSMEREKIKAELYYPAKQTDTMPINKDSKESFRSNQDSPFDPKTTPEKEIPEAIRQAINDYKQAHPQEYQQERQRIDREKASAGTFRTQTLEEWQQKDKEYQDNKKSHCNTAIGSLLKEIRN